jgi:hypothetical protein
VPATSTDAHLKRFLQLMFELLFLLQKVHARFPQVFGQFCVPSRRGRGIPGRFALNRLTRGFRFHHGRLQGHDHASAADWRAAQSDTTL